MVRNLLLPFLVVLTLSSGAQAPFGMARHTSPFTYIYRIGPEEAARLFASELQKAGPDYLHTRMDSFPTGKERTHPLPPGNYLMVHAQDNQLVYHLETVGELRCHPVNNHRDLVIALFDKESRIVSDARVFAGKKRLLFDKPTQTYRVNRWQKPRPVKVIRNGVVYYFTMPGRRNPFTWKRLWWQVSQKAPLKWAVTPVRLRRQNRKYSFSYFSQPTPHERRFRGFMVFNKPRFRPGDTLRLKAVVWHRTGKPVKTPLLLRLTDHYFGVDTVIRVLRPFRPGSYETELVLNDALDLDLDSRYLLTLETERSRRYDLEMYDGDDEDAFARKRKVVMRGRFDLEEYELGSLRFTARSSAPGHQKGEPLSVFLKATDENDL
ncbi:MAG TPA: hypothetical protein VHK69_05705, partial [Chitinophagaceae bacterium]|nr:hypothetical protein [Chitinophagaceae bacterium]